MPDAAEKQVVAETTERQQVNVIVQQGGGGMAAGICALVFSIVSLLFFALLFVPLSIICSIIAIIKKQYILGIVSIIICGVSFMLSPTLLALFGLVSLM